MNPLRAWPLAAILTAVLLAPAALPAAPHTAKPAALTPAQPEQFFLTPGQAGTLAWKTTLPAGRIDYALADYEGRPVAAGTATVSPDGALALPLTLARGYYEITLAGETFGIVAQDPFTRAPDPFFGMDSVLTWLDRRPAVRVSLVKILRRSGVALSRERFRWKGVNPAPGKWNWAETDHADDLRAVYKTEGVPVLEMFHDPGPARGEFPVPTHYPQDLVQLTRSWPVIHERWKDTWAALEVWNEPDGRAYGAGLPPDQYVPLVKAMRWTFQQHGITAPLGGGVLIGTDPGDYTAFLTLNGLLDHVDFVSFHDYRHATDMQDLVGRYRRWMQDAGKEGMPLWLTEAGFPWPKGAGRARLADGEASAMEIAMKGIEARACGIARFMPFCLAFYEEGGAKSFSLFGREVTPLRSFAAYAQSIRALAGRAYAGDLRLPDAGLLRARVFGPAAGAADPACVAVLYTGKAGPVRVALPFAPLRAEAVDGRRLSLAAGNTLTIEGGLAYLYAGAPALAAVLDRDTPAAALLAASHRPLPPSPAAGPVVLQNRVNPAQVTYSPARYLVDPAAAAALKLTVRAVNLSATPERVRLGLQLPGEPAAPPDRVQTVTVPAQGTADVEWTVDAGRRLDITRTLPVTIRGLTADDRPVSPLVLPFRIEGTLEAFKQRFPGFHQLPLGELSRWEKNIAPHGTMSMTAEGANGWRLATTFDRPGDRWIYPKFRIPPGALADAGGFVLRLRAKEKAALRLMLFDASGGGYWTSVAIAPADGRWHVACVSLSELEPRSGPNPESGKPDLSRITSFSIGMNDASDSLSNVIDVSDVLVVGPRP